MTLQRLTIAQVTIAQALNESIERLERAGKDTLDGKLLLAHLLDVTKMGLLLKQQEVLTEELYEQFIKCIELRISGIPLQQIIGSQNFMGYEFKVNEDVLIPRPETELLVEWGLETIRTKFSDKVLNNASEPMLLMDMCTGTGCIPISMAIELPSCSWIAVDYSEKALAVARENCLALGAKETVKFVHSDLFQSLELEGYKHQCDCIFSNPPYIVSSVIETLDEEVRKHEPRMALDGGQDGLDFYRIISKEARRFLKEDGYLFLEIGYDQNETVSDMLQKDGYRQIECRKDYSNNWRMIRAQYNSKEVLL